MKKIVLLIVFLISGYFSILPATENILPQPANWSDIRTYTIKNNPELLMAKKSLETARVSYYQSLANFLPQINLSAGKNWNEDSEKITYGISGSLSLFNGGQDLSITRIKSLEIKITEENYRRTLADVIFNVRKSFLNLLAAQENVFLTQKILNRRQQNYELVKLKYEAGREDRGSFLRSEADKIQAEYEYNKARRELKTYSQQLARSLGLETYEIISVTGTFSVEEVPDEQQISSLVENIPEMKIAEYNYRKSEIALTQASGNFYPQINLSASKSFSGTNLTSVDSFENYGISLNYQIFSGGRNLSSLKIARNNKEILAESKREVRQQLLANLETAYNDLISAIENVWVRQNYLKAAEEQSQINTVKYINGLLSYQDWYTLENDLIAAQKALLEARKNAELSLANWKNILGVGE